MKITLTPGEREILLDRPEDCIAQALADTEELHITEAEALLAYTEVAAMVSTGEIHGDNLSATGREVLADMADGSTFFADWQDREGSAKAKARALLKSAASLETKLSALLGRNLEIPTW